MHSEAADVRGLRSTRLLPVQGIMGNEVLAGKRSWEDYSQDCVDSLRRDLTDLQGAVLDVFSRTGPVRFPSWKFPDTLSCNLDLVNLLEQYDYAEGEAEFNQHSHIVLLELVIDRLMLLLQSFTAYVELITGQQRAGRSGQSGPSVSIGLVVKRYWNTLVQFSNHQHPGRYDRQDCEDQRSVSHTDGTPSTVRTVTSSTPPTHVRNTNLTAPTSPLHHTALTSITTSARRAGTSQLAAHRTAPPAGPAPPTRSASCQTEVSALVPCESCVRVQVALKETAEALVALCQCLDLPCSLQRLLVVMEDTLQRGRLSASDLALWVSEQHRDTEQLNKHMTEVRGTVESLKERVRKTEGERDQLRTQLEREEQVVKREREERRRREEEWETRLQEERARVVEEERRLQEEQDERKREATALEMKVSELTGQLELVREMNQSLECERDSLVEEVHKLHLQEVTWEEVEERRRGLEAELNSTQKLLVKECAKYQSAQRQQEAMQVKQRALLERVDVLVQQYDDVQSRLEECEGERAELTDTLAHTMQQKDILQEDLTQQRSLSRSLSEERVGLQERLCELEETVSRLNEQLQQAAQRERMLVAFPELSLQQPAPQSTGDVLCDMEQQLKANTLRIRVLEQENTSLSTSLSRLRDTLPHSQSRGDHSGRSNPSNSSPSSALQQQTPSLHLHPDTAETYNRLHTAAHARSAPLHRRRK